MVIDSVSQLIFVIHLFGGGLYIPLVEVSRVELECPGSLLTASTTIVPYGTALVTYGNKSI